MRAMSSYEEGTVYYRLLDDGTAEPTQKMQDVVDSMGWVLDRSFVGWIDIVTFFLGYDASGGREEPVLWETAMEFAGQNTTLARYSAAEIAEDGHRRLSIWAHRYQRKIYSGWCNELSVLAALEDDYESDE